MNKRVQNIASGIAFGFFVFLGFGSIDEGSNSGGGSASDGKDSIPYVITLPYEVVNNEVRQKQQSLDPNSDELIKKTIDVVIEEEEFSKKELRATLREIYRKESSVSKPLSIFITAYPNESVVGGAGFYARLRKAYNEEDYQISVNERAIKAHKKGDSERFGFKVKERKEIYKAIYQAEERAFKKAEEKYPTNSLEIRDFPSREAWKEKYRENSAKKQDFAEKLMKRTKRRVREKYGISQAVADSICKEALDKGWKSY